MTERLFAEVPFTTTVGVMHPHGGTLPGPTRRTATVFPSRGKLYLAGLRTFVTDDDQDLLVTILHPRTGRALLGPGPGYPLRDVHAVQLNPDVLSRKYVQAQSYAGMFVPIWGELHEEGDIEPAYCSKDLPLKIEIEGDAVLHLCVLGADHYTVTAWPEGSSGSPGGGGFLGWPGSEYPRPLGEFRGPYGTAPSASALPDTDRTGESRE